MDFTNRGVQPSVSRGATTNERQSSSDKAGGDKKGRGMRETPKWLKVTSVLLLFAGTLIVVGIISLLLINPGHESRLVEKDKYQAVFLDNGQVYFGRINSINSNYIDLISIYYLNVDESVQPAGETETQQNISLKKLGCELHGPSDRMVVNREHVIFWENLRSEGKVTEAITDWINNNPEGLKCSNGDSSTTEPENGDNAEDTNNDDAAGSEQPTTDGQ